MFVSVSHIQPSLVLTIKSKRLPFELKSKTGSNHNYEIRAEMHDNDKHSSLLQNGNKYERKKFGIAGPGVYCYKTIYGHNSYLRMFAKS